MGALLLIVVVAGLLTFFATQRRNQGFAMDWPRFAAPWLLLASATLAFAVFLEFALGTGGFLAALVLAAFALFGVTWSREFRSLMSMTDECFPGRNDKLIWALLMILLPPVGVAFFGSFRRADWPAEKPHAPELRHELS